MSASAKFLFISYRREDAAPAALALKLHLQRQFTSTSIFLDQSSITPGEKWPDKLRTAVGMSDVVLILLSPGWYGRLEGGVRRIDDEGDWVRQEAAAALSHEASRVIPIALGEERFPTKTELPPDLQSLAEIDGVRLRYTDWISGFSEIEASLVALGFQRETPPTLPSPNILKKLAKPLSFVELKEHLAYLPEWSAEVQDNPKVPFGQSIALTRNLKFKTFKKASEFIFLTADHFNERRHHPIWNQIWKTVKISLTTWDAGNQITQVDIELAIDVNKLYNKFMRTHDG